jgi:hypothetical protein
MALVYSGTDYMTCLSSDTKPATLPSGFVAYETDTNVRWIWNGTIWNVQDIFLQGFKKFGTFAFQVSNVGDGILAGVTSSTGAGGVLDTTLKRKYNQAITGAVNGNNAGWIGLGNMATRSMNPRLYCEFKLLAATGNQRVFIGFQSNTTAAGGSDDPLNALEGFYFGCISTDSVWKILSNDSAGATVSTAVTAVTTIDTAVHKVWVVGDEANTRFGISIDGNAYQYVSTNIPASTTALTPHVEIEASSANSKELDVLGLILLADS